MSLSSAELIESVRIHEKMERGQPLTADEQKIATAENLGPKPCGCERDCGLFLEPRVDGEHLQIDGKDVNPDCYYELFEPGQHAMPRPHFRCN